VADLALAKKLCLEGIGDDNPELILQFERFEYSLKYFLAVDPYIEPRLTLAVGYMYFLTEIVDAKNDFSKMVSLVFDKTDFHETPSDWKIYTWCKQEMKVIVDENDFNNMTSSGLQKLNLTVIRHESRPIFYALLGEKFGFGKIHTLSTEIQKRGTSSISEHLPKARFLEGYRRLALKILLSSVTQDPTAHVITCTPTCDGDNCQGSSNGNSHVARWAIFCPNCGDSEMYCEEMKQYLHYSSNSLPITFTKSCKHFIFESRNCEVVAIQKIFPLALNLE
jgi:hypothetical protein